MKASELIKQLQEKITEYGDLEVKCYPYDGQERSYDPVVEVIQQSNVEVIEIDGE